MLPLAARSQGAPPAGGGVPARATPADTSKPAVDTTKKAVSDTSKKTAKADTSKQAKADSSLRKQAADLFGQYADLGLAMNGRLESKLSRTKNERCISSQLFTLASQCSGTFQ